MDDKRVFHRTAAGEEAVRQPTRLLQRNLRNALRLVDGIRNRGEVLDHFPDKTIGSAALADLLRAGMIEIPQEGGDSPTKGKPNRPLEAAIPAKVKLPEQIVDSEPGAAGAIIETITVEDIEDVRAAFSAFGREFRQSAERRPQGSRKRPARAGPNGSKPSRKDTKHDQPSPSDEPATEQERQRGQGLLRRITGLLGLAILGQGIATFLPADRLLP